MYFKLKTLTPIWTGSIGRNDNSTLRLTGIKGSIRWWCEALIRGLGGYACNPASRKSEEKCEFNARSYRKTRNLDEELRKICPACQLFGCTGWSGKFNLRIESDTGNIHTQQLPPDTNFAMKFIETKKLTDQEIKLINATIKIIIEYAAIGGRIGLKPSESPHKNYTSYPKRNHLDYGLLAYQDGFGISRVGCEKFDSHIKDNEADWPDLKYFWFVKGACITRELHNELVNRDTAKGRYQSPSEFEVFLGGYIKRELTSPIRVQISSRGLQSDSESKKIFSFHGTIRDMESGKAKQLLPPRCFGYTRNGRERDKIGYKLKEILNGAGCKYEFKHGEEILDDL